MSSSARPLALPQVSVVMIFFNAERLLPEAIESVLAQTLSDLELILVDDGSTDASAAVAAKFEGGRVRLLRGPHRGVAAARNAGIAAARGEFLAYCDADDVQRPYRLAAQAAVLDRAPEVALVGSDFESFEEDRIVAPSHLRARWLGPTTRGLDTELREAFPRVTTCAALEVPVPDFLRSRDVYLGHVPGLLARIHLAWGCAQMARLDAVRAVGGHSERLRTYEDWALASEIAKRHEIAFIDAPLLSYRIHPEQLTGRPRMNVESYRDVVQHVWRDDPRAFAAHRRTIDCTWGSALFHVGEVEALDGRWAEAERAFAGAIAAWPRLKRAYPSLAHAALHASLARAARPAKRAGAALRDHLPRPRARR